MYFASLSTTLIVKCFVWVMEMAIEERRRFKRVDFKSNVELSQSGQNWQTEVIDISLKGLLIGVGLPASFDVNKPIVAKILLSDLTVIAMDTMVAHQTEEHIGLSCLSIDVESIRHLRRLITLNIGDADASEREILEMFEF